MKPETTGKVEYGGWGIVFGAIIVMPWSVSIPELIP